MFPIWYLFEKLPYVDMSFFGGGVNSSHNIFIDVMLIRNYCKLSKMIYMSTINV